MPRVLFTDPVITEDLAVEREILASLGCELLIASADDLAAVASADALIVNLAQITATVLRSAGRACVIARTGIGVDNIDLDLASELGIVVTNAPGYAVDEVSDHALALLLSVARRLPILDRDVRAGGWDMRKAMPAHRLRGRTLGLIGFGQIGQALAAKAQALGLRVLFVDPFVPAGGTVPGAAKASSLDDLLAHADYISLHLPLTESTRHLIDEKRLRLIRPGTILINTARGELIDNAAIVRALDEGRLAGVGLDVLEHEPPSAADPLTGHPLAIVTPHVGGYSEEAVAQVKRMAAEQVAAALRGFVPEYIVNRSVLTRAGLRLTPRTTYPEKPS
jgi:D-3-phosphoglycerate dehydrogenase